MPVAGVAPALAFTRVSKRFGDGTVALAGVDLSVAPGEFVSVVGPSGCGKSTLLRIASGLETASEGTVHVSADKLGYVFQDPTLLPWRTVQANVELLAELANLPKQERRRRANDAIKLVGLSDFADKHPRALSGGMRMRVSLARSLTLQPELFLFDEPFGALDEITRQRLNDELLQLFLTQQFTALFITHSVSEAVFMSTRVVVMSGRPGRVVGDFPVPFEYPRPPRLRFDERFAHIAGEVSACLRGEGQRQSQPGPPLRPVERIVRG
jgi:NitT/TauT family transport system ATP-binding protein